MFLGQRMPTNRFYIIVLFCQRDQAFCLQGSLQQPIDKCGHIHPREEMPPEKKARKYIEGFFVSCKKLLSESAAQKCLPCGTNTFLKSLPENVLRN